MGCRGAIAGKFILYTAFRINFYCLSLIFHNKYYKRYIFPSRYLAVVPMVIEKLLLKVITPQLFFLIGLITVSDAILTGRQSGQKLQCLYGNPMAKNFFQNRILRNL